MQEICIANSLVVAIYNVRDGRGGLAAFNQENGELVWDFSTPDSVESGLTQAHDCFYFATKGFLGLGATLYCLRADGSPAWQKDLPAVAWSRPVVDEARVYIGLDNGQILGYDSQSGYPLSTPRATHLLQKNKQLWLLLINPKTLVAISQTGEILALNPIGLETLWTTSISSQITTPPCLAGDQIIFGAQDGQLLALDTRKQNIKSLAKNLTKICATPVFAHNKIWVGAYDHSLHIFDIQTRHEDWRSPQYEHSISVPVFVNADLCAICVNQFGIVLLGVQNREHLWEFRIPNAQLFSNPVISDDVVFVGTDKGDIFALPWHLGFYEKVATHLESTGKQDQAGLYYALAARQSQSIQIRENLYQKAEQAWHNSGHPELAALMWKRLANLQKEADSYKHAGEHQRGIDNHQAAKYFLAASRLYWQADEKKQFELCSGEATKLGRWPLLRLEKKNNPKMIQGKSGSFSLRVSNIGYAPAQKLRLLLGGSLSEQVTCAIIASLDPEFYLDITLPITPTQPSSELTIEVEYFGHDLHIHPFRTNLDIPIEAGPAPHKIKIGDSIFGHINIVNANNQPIDVEMGDSIKTDLNVILLSESPDLPAVSGLIVPDTFTENILSVAGCWRCQAALPENAKHCDACGEKQNDK